MEEIKLYDSKEDCCGCGACLNICPKNAIEMKEDENGFYYPVIDEKLCIHCRMCQKVCFYQIEKRGNISKKAYAAVNLNESDLLNSASGGIFSAIASEFLKDNGIVFGSSLNIEKNNVKIKHVSAQTIEELKKMFGSKYVQSSTERTFKEVLSFLKQGKKVLYSGTPCQIDGLYGFLGKKYDNLFTIDLICHGVPNEKFLNSYLNYEKEKNYLSEIKDFYFRDKKNGWGMNSKIIGVTIDNKEKIIYKKSGFSSYFTLFLNSDIYRENCYSCKYASERRVGDITIGDFWGIEKAHPELLKKKYFDVEKGISCILVNTLQGDKLLKSYGNNILKENSTIEKIKLKNTQLVKPSKKSEKRDEICKIYRESGYEEVEKYFLKKYRKQIIKQHIFQLIPKSIKKLIKNIIFKLN